LNDDRLKNLGGGNYWKELLDRIRDIRSSAKVMYRQVLDLYATATDYHPIGITTRGAGVDRSLGRKVNISEVT